jgi:biotin carboxylase
MNDALLVIGGRPQAVRKARDLGLRVVWLQHKKPLAAGHADAADAVIMLNYHDTGAALPMVRAAHQAFGFRRVVTLVDQAMELAGAINEEFSLPGIDTAQARRFRDKLAMRTWLRDRGFENVAAEPVADARALDRFGARAGYPFVLKPVDGTASRGVIKIDSAAEVEQAWRAATALRDRDDLPFAAYYPVREFLAEEYLDGPEYSVEAFSFGGRHAIIAITSKSWAGFIEMGHAQPAALRAEAENAIAAHVTAFLDAMGLRDGVSHTEVKLTCDGPRIVEGHSRVAGGRIMDLVAAVYGIDLECYAVAWPFHLVPELPTRPRAHGAAATAFLTARPGTVVTVEGADQVRARTDVLDLEVDVAPGDIVPELTDNFCRPGQVLVTAADTGTAVDLAARLANEVRIVTRRAGPRGRPPGPAPRPGDEAEQ